MSRCKILIEKYELLEAKFWDERNGKFYADKDKVQYRAYDQTKDKDFKFDNPDKGITLEYMMPSDSEFHNVGAGGTFKTLKDAENYILKKSYKLYK